MIRTLKRRQQQSRFNAAVACARVFGIQACQAG
jgi:hypothetical protein